MYNSSDNGNIMKERDPEEWQKGKEVEVIKVNRKGEKDDNIIRVEGK